MAKSFSGHGVTAGLAADRAALTGLVAGQQFFETNTSALYVYTGSAWQQVTMGNTSGTVLKVHSAEGNAVYNQFHYSTKTRLTSYDFSITAAGTNSRFVAFHHNWFGSRTNGVSAEIWYQVNGGAFSCLGTNNVYGRTGLWNGSADNWMSTSWMQNAVITAAAGATINFTIYVLSGHAGGTSLLGTVDAVGHPDSNYVWTIFEVVP